MGGWVVPNGRQLFLDYTPNGPPQEPDQDDVVNDDHDNGDSGDHCKISCSEISLL